MAASNGSARVVSPTDDPTSPFFIHPSENAGIRVVVETFDGNNYIAWTKSVMSLTVKGKFGFLNGSIPIPFVDDTALYKSWEKVNALLLTWMVYSCTPEVRKYFGFLYRC